MKHKICYHVEEVCDCLLAPTAESVKSYLHCGCGTVTEFVQGIDEAKCSLALPDCVNSNEHTVTPMENFRQMQLDMLAKIKARPRGNAPLEELDQDMLRSLWKVTEQDDGELAELIKIAADWLGLRYCLLETTKGDYILWGFDNLQLELRAELINSHSGLAIDFSSLFIQGSSIDNLRKTVDYVLKKRTT